MNTLFLIAIGLISISVLMLLRAFRNIASSEITVGRVVELVSNSFGDARQKNALLTPKIMYFAKPDQRHSFIANVDPYYSRFKVGEIVVVSFKQPFLDKARILTFHDRFGLWFFTLGTGSALLLIHYSFKHGNEWLSQLYF